MIKKKKKILKWFFSSITDRLDENLILTLNKKEKKYQKYTMEKTNGQTNGSIRNPEDVRIGGVEG